MEENPYQAPSEQVKREPRGRTTVSHEDRQALLYGALISLAFVALAVIVELI
jgi:hypothetical protein